MSTLIWFIIFLLVLPVLIVGAECLGAMLISNSRGAKPNGNRPRLAVLIPAHNEANGITKTLDSLSSQLETGDMLLVVADNCTDETAHIAVSRGATVIERFDDELCGKGFALAYGINKLQQNPPDILIMIDADNIVENGAIDTMVRSALRFDSPVQALNLIRARDNAPRCIKITEFACVVKNRVRALGLSSFGLPVQLMGTGMAFPWHIIKDADLASDAIVEDMQLGLQLAMQGHKPRFCPDAKVISYFPNTDEDAVTQRRRWEHGHISMILEYVPKLFVASLCKKDVGLFALGLDLMVPPLALQVLLLLAGLLLTALIIPFGLSPMPFLMLFSGCIFFAVAIMLAWYKYARHIIGFKELLAIPGYIISKLSVYTSFIHKRESRWIRTGRGDSDE